MWPLNPILSLLTALSIYSWMPNSAMAMDSGSKNLCRMLFIDQAASRFETIPAWSKNGLSKIDLDVAQYFLPAEFQEKIEKEQGPIRGELKVYLPESLPSRGFFDTLTSGPILRTMEHFKTLGDINDSGFRLSLSTRDHPSFIEATVIFDQNPEIAYIEGLAMSNPLNTANKNLHITQHSKGLPYPVFKHLKKSLFGFLEKGGIKTIATSGAQDYTVSLLYRKFLGFKPNTEYSEKIYTYLDNAYDVFRKLPEPMATKNADEFSKIVGTIREPDPDFLAAELEWQKIYSGEKSDWASERYYDNDGNIIGVRMQAPGTKRSRQFLLNFNYKNYFFHWSRVNGLMTLEVSQ
jgi:hypothetical protein